MDKVNNQHIKKRSADSQVIPVTSGNLVHITQSLKINAAPKVNKVTIGHPGHLTYDHNRLVEIGITLKSDYWFSVLDPSTVKIIRRLRLNKRGHRGGSRRKSHWRQMGVNDNMLGPVPITKKKPLKDKNNIHIWMNLLNAQSIWDKDGAIVDYFLSKNINMAIITESWLQNTGEDACRLSTSEFCTDLFSAIPSNRQDRIGGGILLVHRKSYKANLIDEVFHVHVKMLSSRYK